MKIELTISTHTLGDYNSDEDNNRYAEAVETALAAEYPDADISVELDDNNTASSCWVSDDHSGEIEEKINQIAEQVWENSDY